MSGPGNLSAGEESNGGALAARLVEVWAPADAARMAELDRLIAAGFENTDPRFIPADELAPPAPAASPAPPETTMACPECKSPTCHKRTCSHYGHPKVPDRSRAAQPQEASPRAVARPRASVRARRPTGALSDLEGLSVSELLELRDEVQEELGARLERVEAERAKLLAARGPVPVREVG